jgi:hypothetical protein
LWSNNKKKGGLGYGFSLGHIDGARGFIPAGECCLANRLYNIPVSGCPIPGVMARPGSFILSGRRCNPHYPWPAVGFRIDMEGNLKWKSKGN